MVKGVVGGLTAIVNTVFPTAETEEESSRPALNSSALLAGIEDDFSKGYLFSGLIEPVSDCIHPWVFPFEF